MSATVPLTRTMLPKAISAVRPIVIGREPVRQGRALVRQPRRRKRRLPRRDRRLPRCRPHVPLVGSPSLQHTHHPEPEVVLSANPSARVEEVRKAGPTPKTTPEPSVKPSGEDTPSERDSSTSTQESNVSEGEAANAPPNGPTTQKAEVVQDTKEGDAGTQDTQDADVLGVFEIAEFGEAGPLRIIKVTLCLTAGEADLGTSPGVLREPPHREAEGQGRLLLFYP